MTFCTFQHAARLSTIFTGIASLLVYAIISPASASIGDTFEVVPSPNPGNRGNFLNGIAAIASDDIWAVGLFRVPGVPSISSDTYPLAIHWDGDAWSNVQLPTLPAPPNGSDAYLNGVVAFDSDDVWAVGGAKPADDLQRPQTLVLHFDGNSWQKISSPVANPNKSGSLFNDVAGVSSNDLWAVGEMNENFLAAHWDGSDWTPMPVPPGDLENQELRALSVIASDNVWAVGGTGEGAAQPIIVQWDGASWGTPIPHPPQSQYNGLWDVKAFAIDDIWVTANSTDAPPQQVFLHWDGASWTSYAAPQFHSARYTGTPNDLYSVGYNEVMHWNGSGWQQVAMLEPELPFGGFNDAVQLTDGSIWGVGRTTSGEEAQTLTARYALQPPGPAADLDGNGVVNGADLAMLLGAWGACADCDNCDADLDGNCTVDGADLAILLGNWG